MCKILNTVKLLGVEGRKAVEFADAYNSLSITHNPKIKQNYLKVLLETPLMGKTLIEHHKDLVKKGAKIGLKSDKLNSFGVPKPIHYTDYGLTIYNIDIQISSIEAMLNYVLQIYFEKF